MVCRRRRWFDVVGSENVNDVGNPFRLSSHVGRLRGHVSDKRVEAGGCGGGYLNQCLELFLDGRGLVGGGGGVFAWRHGCENESTNGTSRLEMANLLRNKKEQRQKMNVNIPI